jgi:hypothetical protein
MRRSILGAPAVLAALLLSACGSNNSSFDDDDGSPGGPIDTDTRSCQAAFDLAKASEGKDCSPVAGTYCPSIHYSGEPPPRGALIPCDGVTITEVPISAGGFDTKYLAVRRTSGTPKAVVMNLHYLGAPINVNTNQLRLAELAVSRDVLVLVPQAPNITSLMLPPLTLDLPTGLLNPFVPDLVLPGLNTLSRWPNNSTLEPVGPFEELLDAVVADGRAKFGGNGTPLYVSGYSDGGVMAAFYACDRPGIVEAVLVSAANLQETAADACPAIAAVLVHGTNDVLAPYDGTPPFVIGVEEIYDTFKVTNGCGADRAASIAGEGSAGGTPINFVYTDPCVSGNRLFLVTAVNGGHTWPAQDDDTAGLDFNTFGTIPRNWDATIYGYDLMKLAAGN